MPLIRWEDHSVHLTNLVKNMYKKLEIADCVLDTDGGLIQGHKTILAACSPFLKKLFMAHYGMEIFPFKRVKYNDMKLVLDFLYYGEVDVSVADVTSLMKTAKFLQIQSLLLYFQNFREKQSSIEKDVSETSKWDNGTKCGINLMKSEEEDLSVEEASCINKGASETNIIIDKTELSEEVSQDQSDNQVSICREFEMDMIGRKEKSSQDELAPITFVAVNPVLKNNEDINDQQNASCVGDPLLENPLEEYHCESDVSKLLKVKVENNFQTDLPIKVEVEEDMSIDNFSSSVDFEDSSVDRTEELEMKFESICDMSECDIKEEKPLQRTWNLENDNGDETLSRKEKIEFLKCRPEESSLVGYHQDIVRGIGLGNVNTVELKEATFNVKMINTTNEKAGFGNNAVLKNADEDAASRRRRMTKERMRRWRIKQTMETREKIRALNRAYRDRRKEMTAEQLLAHRVERAAHARRKDLH